MITASIVLYKTPEDTFCRAINCFLDSTSNGLIIVSDNSPTPSNSSIFLDPRVRYCFNNANLGFGVAHNMAFSTVNNLSSFHLFLNPDIRFSPEVVNHIIKVFEKNADVGMVMPKIIYPSGINQYLAKLLPTPFMLLIRRFLPFNSLKKRLNKRYQLFDLDLNRMHLIPSLSGCFLFVRSQLFIKLGGFDERYFMYLEDVDLVRRFGDISETIYCPMVSVEHDYAKGSYKNPQLLWFHLVSAFHYFNKWGWIYDNTRTLRNKKTLQLLDDR